MGRTKGAKDKKKRKPYKNRKYKYRKKHGKFVPYIPARNRDDPLKIWFWWEKPKSKEAYMRVPPQMRSKVWHMNYHFYIRADVPPERLANEQELKDLAIDVIGHEGTFLLMMFCKRKNKGGVSPCKVAKINISEHANGFKVVVSETRRISRYWFWQKK